MSRYKAISSGFMHGRMYGPNTKRPFVSVDKPLKPVPSWLELVEDAPVKANHDGRSKKTQAPAKGKTVSPDKETIKAELGEHTVAGTVKAVAGTKKKVKTL